MRSLAALFITLSTLALSSASAQLPAEGPPGAARDAGSAQAPAAPSGAPALPAPAATPELLVGHAEAEPPAAPPETIPPPVAADASALENRLVARAEAVAEAPAAREDSEAARQLWTSRVRLADDWMSFEEQRDARTRAAERVFFPLALGLEAGLGIAYAVAAEDVSQRSRIVAGVTAGLALGAAVPALLSSSRTGRRAWFAAGAAAFAFGAGATIITAPKAGEDERAARWTGASVALQGLAFLPLALIPGFPDEAEYQAYKRLPESERPDAAARILTRIDRFEQRATAISLLSALSGALVLAAGALSSNDRDQARTLAGLSLVPLGTMLIAFTPRLFVRSRLDRFSVGEKPVKLPFNGW